MPSGWPATRPGRVATGELGPGQTDDRPAAGVPDRDDRRGDDGEPERDRDDRQRDLPVPAVGRIEERVRKPAVAGAADDREDGPHERVENAKKRVGSNRPAAASTTAWGTIAASTSTTDAGRTTARTARLSIRGMCGRRGPPSTSASFDTTRTDREPSAMDETQPQSADDPEPWTAAQPEPYPEPSPEPRGPHLPDVLGRLPWLAWVFVALAIGDLAWMLLTANFPADTSIADVIGYLLRITPGVAAILMPAAVLLRHRAAWRQIPTVLFGAILFAAVQALVIVSDPLQPLFESLTPASEELPGLVPLSVLFDAVIALVSVIGIAYIAIGLGQARRYADRPARAVALIVPVAAALATVVGVLSASRYDFGGTPMSLPLGLYLAVTVVLGILRVVVWAYLAAIAVRGWWSGEQPNAGWWLAVLATTFVLIALALVNIGGILDPQDPTFVSAYGYVTATAYALGHLCLLAAFAVGLPALDEEDVEEDEPPETEADRRYDARRGTGHRRGRAGT